MGKLRSKVPGIMSGSQCSARGELLTWSYLWPYLIVSVYTGWCKVASTAVELASRRAWQPYQVPLATVPYREVTQDCRVGWSAGQGFAGHPRVSRSKAGWLGCVTWT